MAGGSGGWALREAGPRGWRLARGAGQRERLGQPLQRAAWALARLHADEHVWRWLVNGSEGRRGRSGPGAGKAGMGAAWRESAGYGGS